MNYLVSYYDAHGEKRESYFSTRFDAVLFFKTLKQELPGLNVSFAQLAFEWSNPLSK